MKHIRKEMDDLAASPSKSRKSLSQLRGAGEEEHYSEFRWPTLRGSSSQFQNSAKSWIANQRVHVFWSYTSLGRRAWDSAIATCAKAVTAAPPEYIKVKLVSSAAQPTVQAAASADPRLNLRPQESQ